MLHDPDLAPLPTAPTRRAELWTWDTATDAVAVRFVGRGPRVERGAAVARLEGDGVGAAWLRQVHSGRVLAATAGGEQGEADALTTAAPDLALVVATADCVPVLLAAGERGDRGDRIAAVHAGWRGVVAGVVPAALTALAVPTAAASNAITAWIGPAIGACCYEVGAEVAAAVAAASGPEVVSEGPGGRPHLDLRRAVELQLRRAGVREVHHLDLCTRCQAAWLWSHRRDGAGAGRNLAWIRRIRKSA